MAKTLNELLRDEALIRLVDLHRFANGEVRKMLALLARVDVTLWAKLTDALIRLEPSAFTVRRLDALLSGVWDLNEAGFRQLATEFSNDLRALTAVEIGAQKTMFSELLPEGRPAIGVPNAVQVYAAIEAKPMQGRLLKEWFSGLARGRQTRISDTLRMGYVTGSTIAEMIVTLRGTRAANYQDGILNIDRRHAEAVVRTATMHTAQEAHSAFYAQNSDLIGEEQWLSTLDNRTTDICMARDGKLYTAGEHTPIGHSLKWEEGPGAIHWQCRSVSTPVLKSGGALGLDLPPVERAAMNGVAAPGTTYKEWLAAQSAAVQDRVLGATKGKLYREGNLSFDKFFNDSGRFLTLEELRGLRPGAFRRAGV